MAATSARKAVAAAPPLLPFLPPDNALDRGLVGAPPDSIASVQSNVAVLTTLLTSPGVEWAARPDALALLTTHLRHRRRWVEQSATHKPAGDLAELDELVFVALDRLLRGAAPPAAPPTGALAAITPSLLWDAAALYGPSNANAVAGALNAAVAAGRSALVPGLHRVASVAERLLRADVPRVIAEAATEAGSEITSAADDGDDVLVTRVNDALAFTTDICCSLAQALALLPDVALSLAAAGGGGGSASAASAGPEAATAQSLLAVLADTYEHTVPALVALCAFCDSELDGDDGGSSDGDDDDDGAAPSSSALPLAVALTPRQRRLATALSHGCLAAGHALLDSAFLAHLGTGWTRSLPAVTAAQQAAAAAADAVAGGATGISFTDPAAVCNRLAATLSALANHDSIDPVALACAGKPAAAAVLRSARHPPSGSYLRDLARVYSLHSRVTRLRSAAGGGGGKLVTSPLDDEQLSYLASLLEERSSGYSAGSAGGSAGASATGDAKPTAAQVASVRDVLPHVDEAAATRALQLSQCNVQAAIERLLLQSPEPAASPAFSGGSGAAGRRGDRFDDGLRDRTLALATQQQEEEERAEAAAAEAAAEAAAAAAAAANPQPYVPLVSGKAGRKAARAAGGGGGGAAAAAVPPGKVLIRPDAAGDPDVVAPAIIERKGADYDDEYDDGYDDYEKLPVGDGKWDSDSEDGKGGGGGETPLAYAGAGASRGGRGGGGGGGGGPKSAPSQHQQQQRAPAVRAGGGGGGGGGGGLSAKSSAFVPPGAAGGGAGHRVPAVAASAGRAPAAAAAAPAAGGHDDEDGEDDEESGDDDAGGGGGGGGGRGGFRGGRGAGGGPRGGRGGRGGRGRGGGPITGHGPRAQGGYSEGQADRKREHKASVGNHNRKRGADKKMAKAMI